MILTVGQTSFFPRGRLNSHVGFKILPILAKTNFHNCANPSWIRLENCYQPSSVLLVQILKILQTFSFPIPSQLSPRFQKFYQPRLPKFGKIYGANQLLSQLLLQNCYQSLFGLLIQIQEIMQTSFVPLSSSPSSRFKIYYHPKLLSSCKKLLDPVSKLGPIHLDLDLFYLLDFLKSNFTLHGFKQ